MAHRPPVLKKLVGRVILAAFGTAPQFVGILPLLLLQIVEELVYNPFLAAGTEPEIKDGGDHKDAHHANHDALGQPFAALIGDSVGVQIAGHVYFAAAAAAVVTGYALS